MVSLVKNPAAKGGVALPAAKSAAAMLTTMALSRADFTSQTKVIVGEDEVEFLLPTGLLAIKSAFFKAACNERWESGKTKNVKLDEEDPDIFAIFLTWIFTADIKNSASLQSITETDKTKKRVILLNQWMTLAKCFVLGEFLQAPSFRNHVSDMLVEIHRSSDSAEVVCGTNPAAINFIYKITAINSPLRSMVHDHAIRGVDLDLLLASPGVHGPCIQAYYRELAYAAIKTIREKKPVQAPWQRDLCVYHTHPDKPAGFSCTKKN